MAVVSAWLVLLVSRCVPFIVGRPVLSDIMALRFRAVRGQGCSLPVLATTGFMVQTVFLVWAVAAHLQGRWLPRRGDLDNSRGRSV